MFRKLSSAVAMASTALGQVFVASAAFAAPVTPTVTQAADTSPVTQTEMEDFCRAQQPTTLFDGSHNRFSVDADPPQTAQSEATGDTRNVNYEADSGPNSSFVYANFIGVSATHPLTRTGGSVNMWGQSTFRDKIWDNTLYDIQTRFQHTVGYSWTCNYQEYQIVDHDWEWDDADVPAECTVAAYPADNTCTVTETINVPNAPSGGGGGNNNNGGGNNNNGGGSTNNHGQGGANDGTSGGSGGGNDVNGSDTGPGSDGDSGCGGSGGTNTDATAGNSGHSCTRTETVTTVYHGRWVNVWDWVDVGTANGSASHTIDDGYFDTAVDEFLAGHVTGVNYLAAGGPWYPTGVRSLACINPGRKGGTWTPKNSYTGPNCNTAYFTTAYTAYGFTFDTILGTLPSASLPAQ